VDARARKDPSRTGDSPAPPSRASDNPPLWLDAVRRFERLVGVPVERLLKSDTYFDTLPKLKRAEAQLADYVAGITDDWYRLFNLPAGSDVRRMREQLSRMERQLQKLTKELAESRDGGKPTARKRDTTP